MMLLISALTWLVMGAASLITPFMWGCAGCLCLPGLSLSLKKKKKKNTLEGCVRGGGAQRAFPYHAGILQCSSYSPGCSHPRQAVSCSLAGFITSRRGTKVFQNHLPLLRVEPVGLGRRVGGFPPFKGANQSVGLGVFWSCRPDGREPAPTQHPFSAGFYSFRGAGCTSCLDALWDGDGGRENAGTPAAVPSQGWARATGSSWLLLSQARPFPSPFTSSSMEARGLGMEMCGLKMEAHGPSCSAPRSSSLPVKRCWRFEGHQTCK